jgi:hypothetical protein
LVRYGSRWFHSSLCSLFQVVPGGSGTLCFPYGGISRWSVSEILFFGKIVFPGNEKLVGYCPLVLLISCQTKVIRSKQQPRHLENKESPLIFDRNKITRL